MGKSTKTSQIENNDKEYTKLLEERLAKLEEQLLKSAQPISATQYVHNEDKDRDIVLTSLTIGKLNLSTEGYGKGIIYTFDKFGDELVIPCEDVKKLIKNNKSFIEGGRVFINDDNLIKSQRLTKTYENILNAEEMMNLFSSNKKSFVKVFENMTKIQKETFRDIIFSKLNKKQDVDMNIVQIVNDALNINIMESFKENEELRKEKDNH